MDMTIKKRSCRPKPTLQLAAVSISGSTCFCCSAFQNQRLLNLSLFSKNCFFPWDSCLHSHVCELYTKLILGILSYILRGKDKPCAFMQRPVHFQRAVFWRGAMQTLQMWLTILRIHGRTTGTFKHLSVPCPFPFCTHGLVCNFVLLVVSPYCGNSNLWQEEEVLKVPWAAHGTASGRASRGHCIVLLRHFISELPVSQGAKQRACWCSAAQGGVCRNASVVKRACLLWCTYIHEKIAKQTSTMRK